MLIKDEKHCQWYLKQYYKDFHALVTSCHLTFKQSYLCEIGENALKNLRYHINMSVVCRIV